MPSGAGTSGSAGAPAATSHGNSDSAERASAVRWQCADLENRLLRLPGTDVRAVEALRRQCQIAVGCVITESAYKGMAVVAYRNALEAAVGSLTSAEAAPGQVHFAGERL